jgi:HPt (histidine-containing phosphotransfer) domain-containing protein
MPRSSPSARNDILDELRAAVDAADLEIILEVFKVDAEAQLNDLGDFANTGKHDAARRVAHRLAGLLAQFGATDAAELAHRMARSTSNPGDVDAVALLICTCRTAVAEICACPNAEPDFDMASGTDRSTATHDAADRAALAEPTAAKPPAKPAHRKPLTLPPQMATELAFKATAVRTAHSRRSEATPPPDG